MKMLTINSHSLETLDKSDIEWTNWFRTLKLAFTILGVNVSSVTWTFDDFYRDELDSLFLLERFGFHNIVVLYCPALLGKDDARMELGNPERKCSIGTSENLKALKSLFPNLRVGIHTLLHADYILGTPTQLCVDLSECQTKHLDLFQQEALLFAFPFGRASEPCITYACKECEVVYLSDNRIPYSENEATGLVNRVHLELGGSVVKFFLKILFSRLRAKTGFLFV
jgi:hypothetical protein